MIFLFFTIEYEIHVLSRVQEVRSAAEIFLRKSWKSVFTPCYDILRLHRPMQRRTVKILSNVATATGFTNFSRFISHRNIDTDTYVSLEMYRD